MTSNATPSNYQLGILFSIGYYIQSESRYIIRHKDKHYIDSIIPLFKTTPYTQSSRTQTQYVLKSSIKFNPSILFNWTPHNSDIRDIPILQDYSDFLRAYIEIHSTLDYSIRHTRHKTKYKVLRLRVYGNKILIQHINDILHQYAATNLKSLQIMSNNKTAILNYTSFSEIESIYNYIYNSPYSPNIWNNINLLLKTPTKPY